MSASSSFRATGARPASSDTHARELSRAMDILEALTRVSDGSKENPLTVLEAERDLRGGTIECPATAAGYRHVHTDDLKDWLGANDAILFDMLAKLLRPFCNDRSAVIYSRLPGGTDQHQKIEFDDVWKLIAPIVASPRWCLRWELPVDGVCIHGFKVVADKAVMFGLSDDLQSFWLAFDRDGEFNVESRVETTKPGLLSRIFMNATAETRTLVYEVDRAELARRQDYRATTSLDIEELRAMIATVSPLTYAVEHRVPYVAMDYGGGGSHSCGCSHGGCH